MLVQTLSSRGQSPKLWLVTCEAQAVLGKNALETNALEKNALEKNALEKNALEKKPLALSQAPLWGLGKTIRDEGYHYISKLTSRFY